MILKLIIQIYDIKSNQIGTSACNNNFYDSIYLNIQHYHNKIFALNQENYSMIFVCIQVIISFIMTKSKIHDICQCAVK